MWLVFVLGVKISVAETSLFSKRARLLDNTSTVVIIAQIQLNYCFKAFNVRHINKNLINHSEDGEAIHISGNSIATYFTSSPQKYALFLLALINI